MIVGAVALAGVTVPAQGAPDRTTLAVEGTLDVVAIDTFGREARAEHLYTVVTDDGAEIPVALDGDLPADGRFRGELVVTGDVAGALEDRDLLPAEGGRIDEDSRAGRVAVAAAEDETTPLPVASSTVAPAAVAAASVPVGHRAYVARMTGVGSVDGSDSVVADAVDGMLDFWRSEPGAVTSFAQVGAIADFAAPNGVTEANACGMLDPNTYLDTIFVRAARQFRDVDFDQPGNHLLVVAGDECTGSNRPAGIATIGSSMADGGRSMVAFVPALFDQIGAHELGHNVGLEHANLQTCPSARTCEYYDMYSVMGLGVSAPERGVVLSPPALGSLYRSQLGLPLDGEITRLVASPGQVVDQSVALAPRGGSSGPRGVLVTDPATGARYSIDSRVRTARDTGTFYGSRYSYSAPTPEYPEGVVIEQQTDSGETYLVTRPGVRASGAWVAGTVFAPSAGLRVTVGSTGGSANVRIQLNAPAPVPVAAAAPRRLATKTPRITGTVRVGRTLKIAVGSWSPRPSYRYQWYANGRKIARKATASSFRLTTRQKGQRITVKVTGRKAGYTTVTKTSRRTTKVAPRRR